MPHPPPANRSINTDVLIRAWEPNLMQEGARFKATTVRRDITFQTRTGHLDVTDITLPGLVIIAPSNGPGHPPTAVDVCARAIPDQIKFTVLTTEELVWLPVAASRDALMNWHIETIQFIDWLRIVLQHEPAVKASQDGR